MITTALAFSMEVLSSKATWPLTAWSAAQGRTSLIALANMHADWWDRPPDPKNYPWLWTLTGQDACYLVDEARAALLEIDRAIWGDHFFTKEHINVWLRVLDNPGCLLDTLEEMPQTLIHGDYWPASMGTGNLGPGIGRSVGTGPAVYDIACLHSLSRWWFGCSPLSLTQMRNHYMDHLSWRLGRRMDRYEFDLGVDTARAWRFVLFWPSIILEHYVSLLAQRRRLRSAVIEPAYASLRRCMG